MQLAVDTSQPMPNNCAVTPFGSPAWPLLGATPLEPCLLPVPDAHQLVVDNLLIAGRRPQSPPAPR
eukprot:9419445-Lingulodinium_polyedra.AAC.1